jgi:acyl transferase domain-containing protein
MGGILLDQSPLFRSVLEKCDGHLAKLPDAPSWSLIDELEKPKDQSNVYRARFSQPLCTALQLGLIALLDSWDIKPNVVVGHSSGEIAAAYAAGYMSLRDAIVTAYYRGLSLESPRASSEEISKGSMCAVGLSEDQSKKLLADYGSRLQVATVNSSTSTTISGDANAIQEIEAACLQNGIFCRRLRTGKGKLL